MICSGDGIDELRSLSADSNEILSEFQVNKVTGPGRSRQPWTASDISDVICGRPDWAIFASCYTCQWKEVADKIVKEHLEKAVKELRMCNVANSMGQDQCIQKIKASYARALDTRTRTH